MPIETLERPGRLFTAGFIFYRVLDGGREYLIMKENNRHREWAMPKGRISGNETELETAKREALEEAGLSENDYEIRPSHLDFKFQFDYGAKFKYKRVTCFAGKVNNPNVVITISDEHSEFMWVDFNNLRCYVNYRILEAYDDLEQKLRNLEGV